ncbi:MAG: PKD domain-containing protein, partial [Bacteroidota bacterium]
MKIFTRISSLLFLFLFVVRINVFAIVIPPPPPSGPPVALFFSAENPTSFCSGAQFNINFTYDNLVLQNGEVVSLEISDVNGVFLTNPLIGGVSPTSIGSISTTFPAVSNSETRFIRLKATRQDGIIFLSDQVQITINPRPQAIATANGPTTFCAGQSVTLSANIDPEIVTYLWSDGSSSSNIFETSVEVNSNGNYTLTVTNTYGCS